MGRGWVFLVLAGMVWGCDSGGGPAGRPEAQGAAGGFSALAGEILVPKCASAGCHAGEGASAGLDLTAGAAHASLVGKHARRRPDRLLVGPGDPEGSYLVERLVPGGDTPLMPLGGKPLEAAEVERIRAWIRDGAKP